MHAPARLDSLERQLHGIFRERLNVEIPSSEMDILETGIVDSLTFVELLVAIEETFGTAVDIEELDLEKFRSIRRMARFLADRQSAPPS